MDKKRLLKAADSVVSPKEYWEKLLEEPSPNARQPEEVEEPAETKNGETEPAEEPAEEKERANKTLMAKLTDFWARLRGR